jgi:AraC-like DNA-binding protein
MLEYRETAPPPALAPFVATFWTLQGVQPEPCFDLVLPDGHAELVIHRTGRFREWAASGVVSEQPPALIAGVMEHAIALSPASQFETVGVRFTPYGLAPLCRHPQHVLSGRLTPAIDAMSPALSRLVADAGQADSLEEALRTLEVGLAGVFARMTIAPDGVASAVRLIERTGGTISMDRIVRDIGITSRQLERQFHVRVGLPPKRYARVVRFQRAVRALVSAPLAPGTELALRHGYYDQAHFTREFRAFTGWAPKAFASRKLGELTRHFVSDSSKTPPLVARDTGRLEDA